MIPNHEKIEYVLKMTCPAGVGIVAGVTGFLAQQDCYISELAQFDDTDSGRLFMRMRFHSEAQIADIEILKAKFSDVAKQFSIEWEMVSKTAPTRTIIMVSKFDHCLTNLLYRLRKQELNLDVVAVVSNHLDLKPIVTAENLKFVYLPVNKENKAEQEAALLDLVNTNSVELIVLARYMQILSDDLSKHLLGRIINIHHSFLPGFKGARPYHQAYDRGVKLIGATAHYVTEELDEGPIIVQSVQPVDHTFTPEMLVAIGRDTETDALAKAVFLHCEHRVFVDGNKTVVFK